MWTVENRPRYNRDHLRYPSDVTDQEWALISPLIPPAKRGGRKRTVEVREVVNGIMYVLSTGCQWRAVPKGFPSRTTLFTYFDLWRYEGVIDKIHHALCVQCREKVGKEASPTACIIDSQSVKSAENVWPAPSASGFVVSGLSCLHKRIRPPGEPLAKMESRAFWSS